MSVRNIWLYLILCTMLLSCAGEEDVSDGNTQEGVNLVLSVGELEKATRQSPDVIQATDQPFRGLKNLLVIPFRTDGAITTDDLPLIATTTGSETVNRVENLQTYYRYYMENCALMRGTNRLLVYAQAAPVSGKETSDQNGLLQTTLIGRMPTADISFSLTPICENTDVVKDAQDLADYLTAIAKTEGWSTTTNEQLRLLYMDFIHADTKGTGLMAGSAANVKAYVTNLREQLVAIGGDLSTAIIAKIDGEAKSCLENGYPSTSLGLPDGAAALRWTGNEFSVRTIQTTLDNINGINRYTYPAELWYYVDSPICTSNRSVNKSIYEQTIDWSSLIAANYQGSSVTANTQSVAVQQPLQYGVGRLQMTLSNIPEKLKDSQKADVDCYSGEGFELTGVIIGGQHTVGFNFKPIEPKSDLDGRFIYDPIVGTTGTVNTLVLQSYEGETVPVVLEFKNKTGNKFHGKDGVIYPNTKFYLIGQVDPTKGEGEEGLKSRVFTQDHITMMTMKVTSLANAYSCMPDLLSPRLEIGVQIVTQWVQSTPTTVIL